MKANRILYLVVILLVLAFFYFFEGRIVYLALYAVLLLPVISGLLAFLCSFLVVLEQSPSSTTIIKAQDCDYTLRLVNRSLFSFTGVAVSFASDFIINPPAKQRVSIPRKAVGTMTVTISGRYKGSGDFGVDYLQFSDFLGLFSFKRRFGQRFRFVVKPRVVLTDSVPLFSNLLAKAYSNQLLFSEDYSEPSDVRRYANDDSFKKIHWKLSAKKNELMVKNYNSSAINSIIFFLDNSFVSAYPDSKDRIILEDKIIESLVSMLNQLLAKRMPVQLIAHGGLDEFINSDFSKLYNLCSYLSFDYTSSLTSLCSDFINNKSDPSNLVFITANMDNIMVNTILRASTFGHNILLLYFRPNSLYNPVNLHALKTNDKIDFQVIEQNETIFDHNRR